MYIYTHICIDIHIDIDIAIDIDIICIEREILQLLIMLIDGHRRKT
jgi:hypothetical protein